MQLQHIVLRLVLVCIFAGFIGYERELNQSHAGFKTHLIVGISATLVALIQQRIVHDVMELAISNPLYIGAVRADPGRLIAQVVSGIGFLGGGAIIVTKRKVSGLTTAASIWSVAALGIALGMGYYAISIVGFIFLTLTLFYAKRLQHRYYNKKVNIEFIGGQNTVDEISKRLGDLHLNVVHLSYTIRMFGDERVYSSMFELTGSHAIEFHMITTAMLDSNSIISIRENNLE